MSDPITAIGLIASCFQIVQLVLTGIQAIQAALNDLPKRIQEQRNNLTALLRIIESIPQSDFKDWELIKTLLAHLSEKIFDIKTLLEKFSLTKKSARFRRVWGTFRAVAAEKQILQAFGALESDKSNLLLCLAHSLHTTRAIETRTESAMSSKNQQQGSIQDQQGKGVGSDQCSAIDLNESQTSRGAGRPPECNNSFVLQVVCDSSEVKVLEDPLALAEGGKTSRHKIRERDLAMNQARNSGGSDWKKFSSPGPSRREEMLKCTEFPGNGHIFIDNESKEGGQVANIRSKDDVTTKRRDFYLGNSANGPGSQTYNGDGANFPANYFK